MFQNRRIALLIALVFVLSLTLGACQPQTVVETVEVEVEKIVEVEKEVIVEKEVEVEVEKIVEVEKENMADNYKLAVILPGVITDADYNTLGYIASTTVASELGVQSAYSESVPPPDVDRVMREYIDAGFNIIFTHGGQFQSQTVELAKQFPDVAFITEGDGAVEDPPPNFWLLDRNFHVSFYVLGATAAKISTTGKIGYLGGLALPFSNAEYNAINQALVDQGMEDVELVAVWTGDFNDPTKARQVADTMMGDGVDVIMGAVNLGMFGIFEGVKAHGGEGTDKVLVTAKYSDKTSFAPDNYVTACLYDFATPIKEITEKIMAGELGGYYPMEFGSGINIQVPLQNVSEDVQAEVDVIIADILSGDVVVEKNTTALE